MNGWQHNGSFVIKFTSETNPAADKFRGRIEHVSSGQTIRFDSLEQLMEFLRRVLTEVRADFQRADTLADDASNLSIPGGGGVVNDKEGKTKDQQTAELGEAASD